MKIKFFHLTLAIVFLLFSLDLCFAEEILHTATFDLSHLQIDQVKSYDWLILPGCELSYHVAEPQLPIRALHLSLPSGAIVEKVEIISTESTPLEGHYKLIPVQAPRILSRSQDINISFSEPDMMIYNSAKPYPEMPVEFAGQGRFRNTTIANFIVYPLQYLPAEQRIRFYSEITFKVIYHTSDKIDETQSISDKLFNSLTNRFTANGFTSKLCKSVPTGHKTQLESDYYPYVIITQESYVPNFQILADWKTQKGVPTKIITTQWIDQNYPAGFSTIVRIRNFLKDAVKKWGILWVLLGGDTNIIPDQKCYAMDCETGRLEDNDIPCDLYLADLDYTWDDNNNGIYGEVDDAVHLYPDIFVGRAPAENSDEIDIFVRKVLTYEKSPDPDYVLRMLFAAEILWKQPYTNTGIGLDRIDERYVPDRFEITKLYEDKGNEDRSTVISAMNRGMNIINHDGHAWWSLLGIGKDNLYISDVDTLSNTDKYSILFSIGCWPAAFDKDCIAEHFVTNPNGSSVAFMGNSRYGWGSPGNPGFGYSDRYNEAFFYYLFSENFYHVGQALAMAKAKFIPYAQKENVYRWCMYELNLLGDPEMPIWTDTPKNLTVTYPAVIPSDTTHITVTVRDGEIPLPAARICLMNRDDVYQFGFTDLSGQVRFKIYTENPSKKLDLTVTAQNFLPFEGQISLQSMASYVAVEKMFINDHASAFIDSMVNPGETIKLSLTLKNYGLQSAFNVRATLRTDDMRISIDDSTADFGDITGSGIQRVTDAFEVSLDSNFVDGEAVNLELVIISAETTWYDQIGFPVVTPMMQAICLAIADSVTGNHNGYAEAGETVEALVWIENKGHTRAYNLDVWAETTDANISIISKAPSGQDSLSVDPKSTGTVPFILEIKPTCPEPSFPIITIHTKPANGTRSIDSLILPIGKTGLNEDMENGKGQWTHAGEYDLWHINQTRSHSGNFSWYCGDPNEGAYPAQMNAALVSPLFYLAPNSALSFWAWYDVALYSASGYEGDGFHVELKVGELWKQLDFVGTGGALNPLLMGNDWLPYSYDLAEYEIGSQMQVRFRFVSDNNPEPYEGVYIDDVTVGLLVKDIEPFDTTIFKTTIQPQEYMLYQNYPNPFNQETTIRYALPDDGINVKLFIYNILGQKVRTLVNESQKKGQYSVGWDGRNDVNQMTGTGIYFYQLKAADFKQTCKMVFMR